MTKLKGGEMNVYKPKTTDIEVTASGFHRLPCDGRHDHSYHFYMYYTKREIVQMWKREHPALKDCNDCGTPIDADVHAEELGMCLECSNDYWGHTGKHDPKYGRLGKQ
jgi:hypothetical protein